MEFQDIFVFIPKIGEGISFAVGWIIKTLSTWGIEITSFQSKIITLIIFLIALLLVIKVIIITKKLIKAGLIILIVLLIISVFASFFI